MKRSAPWVAIARRLPVDAEDEGRSIIGGSTPGQIEVLSPMVGLWRDGPSKGSVVLPGCSLGAIETLGRTITLVAPEDAAGVVIGVSDPTRARRPVGYKTPLLILDPQMAGSLGEATSDPATDEAAGLVFVAPMSGRFYERPSPDKPAFVTAGQSIKQGDTVCLLEVMKTFNRVTYSGGGGLPDHGRVKRVIPADGADLNAGDPIIELEAS